MGFETAESEMYVDDQVHENLVKATKIFSFYGINKPTQVQLLLTLKHALEEGRLTQEGFANVMAKWVAKKEAEKASQK